MKRQIQLLLTVLFVVAAPEVHAMTSDQTQNDFDEAAAAAAQELKTLRTDFHIAVRERHDGEDSAAVAAAEVETLPSAEVSEPWILHAGEASLDVLDGEEVGPFQSAQLVPGNGSGDGGARF